jgi:PilZ domain
MTYPNHTKSLLGGIMSDSDRRMYQRVSFDGTAELSNNEQSFTCQITDLSLRGVLVRPFGVVRADLGTEFTLTIPLVENPDESCPRIEMQLRLAHSNPDGLGFKCMSIDLDSITHLRQIVELNSKDPQLLERELELLVT